MRGLIRWKRANDGFVESHDGQWHIAPLYWGCTRPQVFELSFGHKKLASYCATQKEAKEVAEHKLWAWRRVLSLFRDKEAA